jgi:D-serine deaminase-like pyridoxal phosphate-dependent protein
VISRLSEEHGIIEVGGDAATAAADVAVGDRLRILPNHACATTNLHRTLVVVRDGDVVDRWEIAAGGRVD